MKPAGILGIILIVVGIIALAYGGFTSFTTKENVAKLGPLEVNKENEHRVPVGPIVGGLCLAGGVVLLLVGNKKTA
jgi:hypothetical protein